METHSPRISPSSPTMQARGGGIRHMRSTTMRCTDFLARQSRTKGLTPRRNAYSRRTSVSESGWIPGVSVSGMANGGRSMRGRNTMVTRRRRLTNVGTRSSRINCTSMSRQVLPAFHIHFGADLHTGPTKLVDLALQRHWFHGNGPCFARHTLSQTFPGLLGEEAQNGSGRVGQG